MFVIVVFKKLFSVIVSIKMQKIRLENFQDVEKYYCRCVLCGQNKLQPSFMQTATGRSLNFLANNYFAKICINLSLQYPLLRAK